MKRQAAVAISLLAFFVFASCVTQPKKKPEPTPTPTPVATPTPAPTAIAAPAAEQAEALELRKKCVEYGLNESMKDDFIAAQEFYTRGMENYDKDNALSASSYKEASARYRALLDKGLASIVEAEKGKASTMKETAVLQGADQDSPDQMASGDAAFADAEKKASAKDPEGAIIGYRAALIAYEIGYERSRAINARDLIDEKDWSQYDPGNYELAGQKLAECDAQFAANPQGSLDAVQESLLRYNLVLKKGWEYALGESRSQSEEEKQKADGIKSDKAAPDEYAQAQSAYEDAIGYESEERYEEANTAYQLAKDKFVQVYATAKGKMDNADGALESLRAKRERSKRAAEEGDAVLGKGGAK